MKKIILFVFIVCGFLNAGVIKSTVGCVDKADLIEFQKLLKDKKFNSISEVYKFSIENDCEMIEPKDKIKQIGKPKKGGFLYIYVEKYDKDLYILSNRVKNKFTQDNHLFNKSF